MPLALAVVCDSMGESVVLCRSESKIPSSIPHKLDIFIYFLLFVFGAFAIGHCHCTWTHNGIGDSSNVHFHFGVHWEVFKGFSLLMAPCAQLRHVASTPLDAKITWMCYSDMTPTKVGPDAGFSKTGTQIILLKLWWTNLMLREIFPVLNEAHNWCKIQGDRVPCVL